MLSIGSLVCEGQCPRILDLPSLDVLQRCMANRGIGGSRPRSPVTGRFPLYLLIFAATVQRLALERDSGHFRRISSGTRVLSNGCT
jgi:hypothetical protein